MSERARNSKEIRNPLRFAVGAAAMGAAVYCLIAGGVHAEDYSVAETSYSQLGADPPFQAEYDAGAARQRMNDDRTAEQQDFSATGVLLLAGFALQLHQFAERRPEGAE